MAPESEHIPAITVAPYRGKPIIHIDGQPHPMPIYSPTAYHEKPFQIGLPAFFPHRMGAYFLGVPRLPHDLAQGWGDSPFWFEDRISAEPLPMRSPTLDEQVEFIRAGDPDAWFIVRNGPTAPTSWRRKHEDQLFVSEDGERRDICSLASDLYWQLCARATAAVVQYCESRSWANRILGYWYGLEGEGTHAPLFEHLLFDHSELMQARWREFLQRRYGTVEALRRAWDDPAVTFADAAVPRDRLRGPTPEVSAVLYWQSAGKNQPLRDYLELQAELFHAGVRQLFAANAAATDRKRLFLYDGFKQLMQGWSNFGFFSPAMHWPLTYPEIMAGSGSMGVADLFAAEAGFDGVITPHDYQVRGVGGICEPEGMSDSLTLRNKVFLTELDVRTYNDDREDGAYGTARTRAEFAAINWRNVATAITRGHNGYWMDLMCDWFSAPELHEEIEKTVAVFRESMEWERRDVPGIAMIIDDRAALETSGDARFPNEAIMWEQKFGISRCGVPYRIYLLEDLALASFPPHRVFYFPNLFRVTDERLALLRERVLRDGNVVLWGPGSGISDGSTIAPEHAARLTGFTFEMQPVNQSRRVHVHNFEHPVTQHLPADFIYGSPLAYGPVLYPTDGTFLGLAWGKQGKWRAGLAAKRHGRGARGDVQPGETLGAGDWTSVFTTAVPVPASLWRNLARLAGAHVWCESNDILLADASMVALHSIKPGPKRLRLPGTFHVRDLLVDPPGTRRWENTATIEFDLTAPATRAFALSTP